MASQPIVFISHFDVKPGHAEALRAMLASMIADLESSKPSTSAQIAYLSNYERRLSIVHLFSDADALAVHFAGANERSLAVYEHIVPMGWEIYGQPHEPQLAGLRAEAAAAGVALVVEPNLLGGFLRTSSH